MLDTIKKYRTPIAAAVTFAVVFQLFPAIRGQLLDDMEQDMEIEETDSSVELSLHAVLSPNDGPAQVMGFQVTVKNPFMEQAPVRLSVAIPTEELNYRAVADGVDCRQADRNIICNDVLPAGTEKTFYITTATKNPILCGRVLPVRAAARVGTTGWKSVKGIVEACSK